MVVVNASSNKKWGEKIGVVFAFRYSAMMIQTQLTKWSVSIVSTQLLVWPLECTIYRSINYTDDPCFTHTLKYNRLTGRRLSTSAIYKSLSLLSHTPLHCRQHSVFVITTLMDYYLLGVIANKKDWRRDGQLSRSFYVWESPFACIIIPLLSLLQTSVPLLLLAKNDQTICPSSAYKYSKQKEGLR